MATPWRRYSVAAVVLLWLGQPGCVIRYGEQPGSLAAPADEQGPQPMDFAPIERELAQMVEDAEVVDSRDRLELAWQLAEQMREADPAAQRVVATYLELMMEVEVRARPVSTPIQTGGLSAGFGGEAVVGSAELAGPEPLPKSDEPEVDLLDPLEMEAEPDGEGELVEDSGPDVAGLLTESTRLLEGGKTSEAMSVLEVCREQGCWDDVEVAWKAARDMQVSVEKEALESRFEALLAEPDAATQRTGFLEIQVALSTLRAAWPGSVHTEALEAQIRKVQEELEALPEDGQ